MSFSQPQTSSFPSENALLQMFSGQGLQRSQENALLMQQHQQQIGAADTEYLARAAQGLLSLPDEASRAAAYPGAVRALQQQGLARNAPPQYGGEAWLKQIAAMGVPAAEQYRTQGSSSAVDAIAAGVGLGPGASAAPAGGGTPFAANNPLNIRYVGQEGATNTNGFAAWPTPEAGQAATDQQLASYADKGINTLTGLINRWAPKGDGANDPPAYIAAVSKATGIAPDAQIDLRNPATRATVQKAMAVVEGNKNSPGVVARAGDATLAPYKVAGLTPVAAPTPVPGGQGLVRDPATGNVGTPNAGGLGTGAPAPPTPPPAALAPPPAAAPPPEMDAHNLTARDRVELDELRKAAKAGRIKPIDFQNEVQQRQVANQARQDKWQAQQHQSFEERLQLDTAARARESHQIQIANLGLAQESHKLAVEKAQREADKANQPLTGDAVNIQHERLLNDLTPKMRDHTATDAEERLYAGSYYALQQSGGQATTMTDPNNPGSTIPAMITRRLPSSFPEPPGGALPLVMASPGAAKREQPTEAQGKAGSFADRMILATPLMEKFDQSAVSWSEALKERAGNYIGYNINSPDYQTLRASQEAFLSGILRHESGQAVTDSEWKRYAHLYFPMPGNDAETVRLKQRFRQASMEGMIREAGANYKPATGLGADPASVASAPAPAAQAPRVIRYDHQGKRIAE